MYKKIVDNNSNSLSHTLHVDRVCILGYKYLCSAQNLDIYVKVVVLCIGTVALLCFPI